MKAYLLSTALLLSAATINAQTTDASNPKADTATKGFSDKIEGQLSIGMGVSGFNTTASEGLSTQLGWGPSLSLTGHYFFNKNWGIGVGLGYSNYQMGTSYTNGMIIDKMIDMDGDEYTLHTEVNGNAPIEETNQVATLDIPVLLTYRFPISHKLKLNTSVGMKFGIPVSESSELKNNQSNVTLTTRGSYPQYGQPDFQNVYLYGFYEEAQITGYNTDNNYKHWEDMMSSLVVDVSLVVPLKNKSDLLVGGYMTYGLNTYSPNKKETMIINRDMAYNGALLGIETARPVQGGVKVAWVFGKATQSRAIMPRNNLMGYYVPASNDSLNSVLASQDSLIAVLNDEKEDLSVKLAATEEIAANSEQKLKAQEEKQLVASAINSTPLLFGANSAELSPENEKELDMIYDNAIKHDLSLLIIGHADENGSKRNNRKVSEKRAEMVYNYFLSKGMDKSKVQYLGKGESEPLINNAQTDEEHQQNRRVNFQVLI